MPYDPRELPEPRLEGEKKPQPPRMTMDECRVAIARLLCEVLTGTMAEVEAKLAQDPERDTSNEAHNGKLMILAGMEFVEGNRILIRKLERPAILRPERGYVVRKKRN